MLAIKFGLGIFACFLAVSVWLWEKFEWRGPIDSLFARPRREAKREPRER